MHSDFKLLSNALPSDCAAWSWDGAQLVGGRKRPQGKPSPPEQRVSSRWPSSPNEDGGLFSMVLD